jgi:hypothetical protein
VVNTSGGVLNFNLSIGVDAVGKRIFSGQEVQPSTVADPFDWSGFLVLLPSEVIQGFASGAGLTMTISGVQIT